MKQLEKRLSAAEGKFTVAPGDASESAKASVMDSSPAESETATAGPFLRESDSTQEVLHVRPSQPPPADSPPAAPEKASGAIDLEALIGGRWLNYIGIIALIFGVAFFMKLAFENDWIGERARVFIGLISGGFLLAYSHRLLARGYRFFSEGIAGLGAGVLFLSLYAGWGFYNLFPQTVAFLGMVGVSGVMVALALKRDSERIGILALLGAFLTPMLLSTGEDRHLVLFTYLSLLNAGLLTLAWARRWRSLDLLSFLGTQFLFWGWFNAFYNDARLVPALFFAAVFFMEFAVLPAMRSLRRETISGEQIFLILADAFWFMTALGGMLWTGYRWPLAASFAALAAAHAVIAGMLRSPSEKFPSPARFLYGGLALTLMTLIVPVLLEGKWMTIAWAVEGSALVWSGLYVNLRLLRSAGLLLLALVVFRLAAFPIASDAFILNARFATFSVTVICLAVAIVYAPRRKESLDPDEQLHFAVLAVAGNVLTLWALSMELWDLFGRRQIWVAIDQELAQQLALSLLWTVYAIALMLLGVGRKAKALRWQALALFGVVVVKVFIYDLSFLQQFYRVLSFIVLGVALLVTSFLYHRRALSEEPKETS